MRSTRRTKTLSRKGGEGGRVRLIAELFETGIGGELAENSASSAADDWNNTGDRFTFGAAVLFAGTHSVKCSLSVACEKQSDAAAVPSNEEIKSLRQLETWKHYLDFRCFPFLFVPFFKWGWGGGVGGWDELFCFCFVFTSAKWPIGVPAFEWETVGFRVDGLRDWKFSSSSSYSF